MEGGTSLPVENDGEELEGCKLALDKVEIKQNLSLVDMLREGWLFSMSVAIDFTSSNGDPGDARGLHYC